MEQPKPDVPFLQEGEKIVGHAYLTEDGEIVFTPHSRAIEVLLVEPHAGASGPWAVRLPSHVRSRASSFSAASTGVETAPSARR
jgi:hypothetical protein